MKILLACDGFPHSRHAWEEAAELAANWRGEVTILGVVPDAKARGSKLGGHRRLRPHAPQDVAFAHRCLRQRGIEAEMKTACGDPAEEIRKEVARGNYEVVVRPLRRAWRARAAGSGQRHPEARGRGAPPRSRRRQGRLVRARPSRHQGVGAP
jgi:nucleotide-binding universal stress UspA family protein